MRDVCPYFLPTSLLVFYFFTLVYFRHVLIGGFIILILTPFYNLLILNDNANIDPKYEKIWSNSHMFMIPMYVYTFAELSYHFYALCLFSDNWQP